MRDRLATVGFQTTSSMVPVTFPSLSLISLKMVLEVMTSMAL